ncbi:UPF0481 protein At3g47200-like [Diospyros lotus]|uniref:UPF0481 protein At3g47200-like n=1 Tax=Diospyros lotus TaxID=55363 RepID=UPI002252A370|nr:UPF0481 protein At3g47200-like [Diospyros lotus]
MKKEEREKDIVADSETNAAAPDNSILVDSPLLTSAIMEKVDLVPTVVGKFKAPIENVTEKQLGSTNHAIDIDVSGTLSTENVLKKQHGSTSHAIDIDVSGTSSSTENEAKITCCRRSIQPHLEEDNKKELKEAKQKIQKFPIKITNGRTWIQPHLERDNFMLVVHEIKSYKKQLKEAKRKILKVPTTCREVEVKNCYDPMVVAIGPYHHADEKLKQMETLKIICTLQFAYQSRKSIKILYKQMENLFIKAKNYYAEDVVKDFDDKDFEVMMFVDGCFVIQFMDSFVRGDNDLKVTYMDRAFIMHDIMLLENQLPFKILTKLMSLRFEGRQGMEMIHKFIEKIMGDPPIKETPRRKSWFWFLHPNSKSEGTSKEQEERICTEEEAPNFEGSSEKKEKAPIHLLELVQTKFVYDKEIKSKTSNELSANWCSYRSVKELKSVGIHFQPSKSCRFSDITFTSMHLYGTLKLPRITIHEGTKSLLLNLLAFENCDSSSNFGVSSYVWFMDTLIDQAEDVKELRSKGIILNLLGNDNEVAKLFNEISEHLLCNDRVFGTIRESLEKFDKSSSKLWLTECLHNHFRSPWAIIAFLAAIVVVCLTITQTVFSAIQL